MWRFVWKERFFISNIKLLTLKAGFTIKEKHQLKIGDSSIGETRPLLASQPFCKLATIEQNIFNLCVKFLQE
jgi:hypothetical protein